MNLTFRALKKHIPALNERRLTADDFWQITASKRCQVFERKMKKKGYYLTNGKEDYIFLDHRLRELVWLEAALHEMIHLLIHYPCSFLKRKHQAQARTFALIAMIPRDDLPGLVREYETLEPVLQDLIYRRLQVLEFHKL